MSEIINCFGNILDLAFSFIPKNVFYLILPFAGLVAVVRFIRGL